MSDHLSRRITKLEEKVRHLEDLDTPHNITDNPEDTSGKKDDAIPGITASVRQIPSASSDSKEAKNPWYKTIEGWYYLFAIIGIPFAIAYAVTTYFMFRTLQNQTRAAQDQVNIMRQQIILQERPWVKISHDIAKPLTFNVGGRATGIDIASITLQDTIENVGATVAMNVFSWEDVIPLDSDYTQTTARARQKEWCDANRHPNPNGASGSVLFPHGPETSYSMVGPQMPVVLESAKRNPNTLKGKVGFVLVGCVCYRAAFESQDTPTHQTRFIYYLGVPGPEVAFNPYILPIGVASKLRLIAMPDGFTVD